MTNTTGNSASPLYLVTGGTGLVGSHLIQHLVRTGKRVRAIRRPGSDLSVFGRFLGEPSLSQLVDWVDGDILDIFSLLDAMDGVSKVYHTAALVSFLPSDRKKLLKVNAGGTANVVNAALEAGVSKLCHVSSVAALGRDEKQGMITENNKWTSSGSNSNYAISKYSAEREVWRGVAEGLPAVVVSPSIILGASDWNKGSSKMFGNIRKGMKFYTTGVNAFVDVRDVVRIMDLLMEGDISNEAFILMSENLCYRDFFNMIAENLKVEPPSIKASPWIAEIAWRVEKLRHIFSGSNPLITRETARTANRQHLYSNEKVRTLLGYEFIPVSRSIEDTCQVFLKTV